MSTSVPLPRLIKAVREAYDVENTIGMLVSDSGKRYLGDDGDGLARFIVDEIFSLIGTPELPRQLTPEHMEELERGFSNAVRELTAVQEAIYGLDRETFHPRKDVTNA